MASCTDHAFFLSHTTKTALYYSLVYPYLTYCSTVWTSTYVTNLNRIFLLQKRAVRAITNSNYLAHSAPLFSDLKILDIFKVSALQTAKFMFFYYHQNLPSVFSNLFITSYQVHGYNTRNAHRFRSHPCRTNIKRFTILFQGPKVWNTLPSSLTSSSSSFPLPWVPEATRLLNPAGQTRTSRTFRRPLAGRI